MTPWVISSSPPAPPSPKLQHQEDAQDGQLIAGQVAVPAGSRTPPNAAPTPTITKSSCTDLPSHTHAEVRQDTERGRVTLTSGHGRPPLNAAPAPPVKKSSSRVDLPGYTYAELIAMALQSSPTGMMTITEIQKFMKDRFECFRTSYGGWRNSIRHNLSARECFYKVPMVDPKQRGRTHYWMLNPHCGHCRQGNSLSDVARQWRYRRSAVNSKRQKRRKQQHPTRNADGLELEARISHQQTTPHANTSPVNSPSGSPCPSCSPDTYDDDCEYCVVTVDTSTPSATPLPPTYWDGTVDDRCCDNDIARNRLPFMLHDEDEDEARRILDTGSRLLRGGVDMITTENGPKFEHTPLDDLVEKEDLVPTNEDLDLSLYDVVPQGSYHTGRKSSEKTFSAMHTNYHNNEMMKSNVAPNPAVSTQCSSLWSTNYHPAPSAAAVRRPYDDAHVGANNIGTTAWPQNYFFNNFFTQRQPAQMSKIGFQHPLVFGYGAPPAADSVSEPLQQLQQGHATSHRQHVAAMATGCCSLPTAEHYITAGDIATRHRQVPSGYNTVQYRETYRQQNIVTHTAEYRHQRQLYANPGNLPTNSAIVRRPDNLNHLGNSEDLPHRIPSTSNCYLSYQAVGDSKMVSQLGEVLRRGIMSTAGDM